MTCIGDRISKARKRLNLSQKELAIKSNISDVNLSRYENSLITPKIDAIAKLAIALEVSTDYLAGLIDNIETKPENIENFDINNVGSRIYITRKFMNLTQQELAIKTNISNFTLHKYEHSITIPKFNTMIKLATVLEVSIDFLLGLTTELSYDYSEDFSIFEYSKDKPDIELNSTYKLIKSHLSKCNVSLNGKPATKKSLDSMLKSIEISMIIAIKEQSKINNEMKPSFT